MVIHVIIYEINTGSYEKYCRCFVRGKYQNSLEEESENTEGSDSVYIEEELCFENVKDRGKLGILGN